jgi:hypothetical protein
MTTTAYQPRFTHYNCALCNHPPFYSLGSVKEHLAQAHGIAGPFGEPEEVGRGVWVWVKDGVPLYRGYSKYPQSPP